MIPVGSYAELGAESMVGDKFVDVTSRGRGPTPPNSELPYQEPTDFFKTLDFSQFEKNMRQMESVLDDIEAGRGLVGQFVTGIELYRDVRGQLLDLERAFHAAASTTGSFGREVYTERLYRQLLDPLTQFDQALARLQSGQGAGRFLTETADYDKAIASVRDLRGSIATLRDSNFIKSDEMYGDWTAWVNRLARSVDEINSGPMFGAPQSYESLNGFARELEETMRDFRGNPRKYLRIKMF
jgi:phospholipid/cholesterol/gamma-HCH transport system substrate-binding protein